MIYLHIGNKSVINEKSIIGIFDLDITTQSYITRNFLYDSEKNGEVITVAEDIPKSFILCSNDKNKNIIYLSQMSTLTLQKRSEENF